MNSLLILLILSKSFCVNGGLFDRYSGKKVDEPRAKDLQSKNATETCTISVKPCVPREGSRLDGTCNNFKYPITGSARGPYLRLLKPDYAKEQDARGSVSGKPLPSARKVRTTLQSTGRVDDKTGFNMAAVHFLEFINKDVTTLNGPLDFLKSRPHCCQPSGEKDQRCLPIHVPEQDPYLKVTDIRCLNFSRAETFQHAACTDTTTPEQINFQTPVLDLSIVYGVDEKSLADVRLGENGLLKMEERNGQYMPLKNTSLEKCILGFENKFCYQFGFPEVGNVDIRTTTMTIFFMREHNRVAKILREINPCWKDDRLFKVARQINIATASNIFMYELLPSILGFNNMVTYGLISPHVEHLTAYDKDSVPLVYAEYEIARRYFHSFLDGRIKKYDESYHYTGELSFSETMFNQEYLENNQTFDSISRGIFFQYAAKLDDIQDPEISENFFASLQKAHDLIAADIQAGRDMGIRGYNEYRKLCGIPVAKTIDDFILVDVMDYEKVEALKSLYENVEDVELLAGIMSENFIQGTFVGPTLFCIMTKQLQIFRYVDRFWFERGDQLHSFTLPQLREVRNANMARFACDNANSVKYIQPRALHNVGPGNMPISCSHISGPNLNVWLDRSCNRKPVLTKNKTKQFPPNLANVSYFEMRFNKK